MAELAQFLACFDCELDAAIPQHFAGSSGVHLRVDIERREERIEGRGRRVHQEGLIEALVLDVALLPADVLVALVHLRCLAEARALLVHRLRREEPRSIRSEILQPHRAVIVKQRMECVVTDPRLVPQHVVAEVTDLLHHLADVVDRAVVGRELDAREAKRPLGIRARLVGHERIGADLFTQVRLVPRFPVDCANHAERIACGRQEDRDRTRHHERALVHRLVVVAIEQHEIAGLEHGAGDDLVRRARAVQNEVRPISTEHLRGMLLRVGGRSFVDQEIAELDVGVAEIVAEDALAEMLEEQLACGGFAVELPALVPGAIESDVRLTVVGHQPAEERGQQ